jgi:hypothetical protein
MAQTTTTRLIKLMEKVEWAGIPNWTLIDKKIQEKHIIPFRVWLRKNIAYLPTEEVRDALVAYFLDGDNDSGSRFYQLKDWGIEAVVALYKKEMDSKINGE